MRKLSAVVRRPFRTADELIAASDAGLEGELIFCSMIQLTGCAGKPARVASRWTSPENASVCRTEARSSHFNRRLCFETARPMR